MPCRICFVLLLVMTTVAFAEKKAEDKKEKKNKKVKESIVLFDGKTLKNWKVTDFGGQGDVYVEDAKLMLGQGEPITGCHWVGPELPKVDYEITFEGQRVDGNDFFCALTFPVQDNTCSLVLGGWGGGVIGLSSIDGMDASENETTDYYSFEKGKWYKIRLRVTGDKIQAWIDDKKIANVDYSDKRISVRIEMELSKPLGLASFQTVGAIRDLKMTKLK